MFLGCGIDDNGGCFLVTEFMDGGSLDRALWSGGSSAMSTSWMQRIQILLDVVDGLVVPSPHAQERSSRPEITQHLTGEDCITMMTRLERIEV